MSQRTTVSGPPLRGLLTARRAIAAGILGAAALVGPRHALAAEPGPDTLPIHIIALQTTDADDQAEALTKALRSAIRAMPGWSLGEGDNALEVLVLKLQCQEPPDASCQSRIADVIKSDRYVWGLLDKKGENVAGELNYWVRGQGTNKVTLDYSANLTEANDEALKKVATDAITQLTGGPPKGQLHVKAGSVSGQVFVDGAPVGALTNGEGTFAVPSGQRRITVKAPGYGDAETTTVVKPTGTVDVALNPQSSGDSKPLDFRKVGGFVGIGTGALLVGLGVVSSLQVNDAQTVLGTSPDGTNPRSKLRAGENACTVVTTDRTRFGADAQKVTDACSKAVFEPLQFVFYALGAAVGGTGLYLVATSSSAPPSDQKTAKTTGWTLTPYVGPQGGGLEGSFRF
ncbi:MAG: carboxypeptidase-like regulatory domain-containing protein [Polyangiaceae bacterium]